MRSIDVKHLQNNRILIRRTKPVNHYCFSEHLAKFTPGVQRYGVKPLQNNRNLILRYPFQARKSLLLSEHLAKFA